MDDINMKNPYLIRIENDRFGKTGYVCLYLESFDIEAIRNNERVINAGGTITGVMMPDSMNEWSNI